MDERTLLLLGMLRIESQHGYQLNEFIEHNLGRVTDMKKPTAYALLDRLEQAGAINSRLEQEGNRPPRKVYAITEQGRQLFVRLLSETLASAEPYVIAGDVGLMFLDALPLEDALKLLEQRLQTVRAQVAEIEHVPAHHMGLGVDLVIEHQAALLRADEAWLTQLIARLQAQPAKEAKEAKDAQPAQPSTTAASGA
ncbi:MAG TPA: PadR family transcriptional regulator [Ktedonobacterales bacterium]|nr:PadR family transcriptional regulator [Ktedonobacterales bacterium]